MGSYLLRRIAGSLALLIGVSVLSFFFMYAVPGGPETVLARNSRMKQSQLEAVRRSMGLDQPVPVQLAKWTWNVARGDLGLSYTQFRPVAEVIGERIYPTIRLMGTAMAASALLSLGIGIASALDRHGRLDHLLSGVASIGLAMPVFWLGLLAQMLFAAKLGWLPAADMTGGPDADPGYFANIKYLILPALTLATGTIGGWSRYIRSSMLDVAGQDYIRTARAKGVRAIWVIARHTLGNALIPFVTVVAIDVPLYLTGAVVVERVFNWPGLGRLFFDALGSRDYPVLMGLLVYAAVLIVVFNILADLIYAWLDPRIKYQ